MNKLVKNYLQELTRYKKEILSDDKPLSDQGIQKLKQAGIIKSKEEYEKGVRQRSKELFRTTDTPVKRTIFSKRSLGPNLDTSPVFAKKNQYVYKKPYTWKGGKIGKALGIKTRKQWKELQPYVDSHEAHEAEFTKGLLKKHKSLPSTQTQFTDPFGNVKGRHKSFKVIKKERDLVNYANRVYGAAEPLKNFRTATGEYNVAKNTTLKQLSKLDKKLAKSSPAMARQLILQKFGGNKKAALVYLKVIKKLRKYARYFVK